MENQISKHFHWITSARTSGMFLRSKLAYLSYRLCIPENYLLNYINLFKSLISSQMKHEGLMGGMHLWNAFLETGLSLLNPGNQIVIFCICLYAFMSQ